jgi:hypothetical protein
VVEELVQVLVLAQEQVLVHRRQCEAFWVTVFCLVETHWLGVCV